MPLVQHVRSAAVRQIKHVRYVRKQQIITSTTTQISSVRWLGKKITHAIRHHGRFRFCKRVGENVDDDHVDAGGDPVELCAGVLLSVDPEGDNAFTYHAIQQNYVNNYFINPSLEKFNSS